MRGLRRVAVIGVGLVALVSAGAVAAGSLAPGSVNGLPPDEFQNPSFRALPPPSAFNKTPACRPTPANGWWCVVPRKRWPPPDPFNHDGYLDSGSWPEEKRPDIALYAHFPIGWDYKNCLAHLTHYCYLVAAEAEGYPISHTPHVGDLWFIQGKCIAVGPGAPVQASCTRDKDWYMGYVDKVQPDGSFIGTSGGSRTSADQGLLTIYFSGATDRYTKFVHLFPAGKEPKSAFPPATAEPQLTATLSTQTVSSNLPNTVIVNWGSNLPQPILVTSLKGGKYDLWSAANYASANQSNTSGLPYGGTTSAMPVSHVPPGKYEVYVALAGTDLPPILLPLTVSP